MSDRLNDFIRIGRKEICALFAPLHGAADIQHVSLIENSMSNTGYRVDTSSGRYLLKLYSNATDQVEAAMYAHLEGKIDLPRLFYHDGTRRRFEFAYAIFEYIEGEELKEHILSHHEYGSDIVYAIGRMCGIVHSKAYDRDAWLDGALNELGPCPDTREQILQLLNGSAGKHLKRETLRDLRGHMDREPELYERLHSESVLCHGDLVYGNVIVSKGRPYLIDFEFARAGSRYHDLGKFFRRKSEAIQSLIDGRIYDAFAEGYHSASPFRLPPDWLRSARLCDIPSMLRLIDREDAPSEWVADIEQDILDAINWA